MIEKTLTIWVITKYWYMYFITLSSQGLSWCADMRIYLRSYSCGLQGPSDGWPSWVFILAIIQVYASDVLLQVDILRGSIVTVGTTVRSLSRVGGQVAAEVVGLPKLFPTHGAHKRLLVGRCHLSQVWGTAPWGGWGRVGSEGPTSWAHRYGSSLRTGTSH